MSKRHMYILFVLCLAAMMLNLANTSCSKTGDDEGTVPPTMEVGEPVEPTCPPDPSIVDDAIALHGGLSAMGCYNQLWNESEDAPVSAKCEGYRVSWEDASFFCKGKLMAGAASCD